MELFVITVNGFQSLVIITKCSILDAAVVLGNNESEKLLAVTIDNKLNFNNHLQKIINKANLKVHVLEESQHIRASPKGSYYEFILHITI